MNSDGMESDGVADGGSRQARARARLAEDLYRNSGAPSRRIAKAAARHYLPVTEETITEAKGGLLKLGKVRA
jgi:hypothetical protein